MAKSTRIKRNDTGPAFAATLKDGLDNTVNLTGATVKFLMRNKLTREVKVNATATVVDAATGRVRYDWQVGDTDVQGTFDVEMEVTFSDATVETFPNGSHHRLVVVEDLG